MYALNLNWKKMLLSFSITILSLFGSWFLIDYVNMDKPIYTWFEEHKTVELVAINEDGKSREIVVRFHDQDSFYKDYHKLNRFLNQLGEHYRIVIDPEQGMFHPFWKEHSIVIGQAVNSGAYGQIEGYLEVLKETKQIREGYAVYTPDGLFLFIDPIEGEDLYLRFSTSSGEGGTGLER